MGQVNLHSKWFSPYSAVRFLGLDGSPAQRSWRSFCDSFCAWGWPRSLSNPLFVIPFMHLDKHFISTSPLNSFKGWGGHPNPRSDEEYPMLLLQSDLRLCPLSQKIIGELESTVPFYFYQLILGRKIMWRGLNIKQKNSDEKAERISSSDCKSWWMYFVSFLWCLPAPCSSEKSGNLGNF